MAHIARKLRDNISSTILLYNRNGVKLAEVFIALDTLKTATGRISN